MGHGDRDNMVEPAGPIFGAHGDVLERGRCVQRQSEADCSNESSQASRLQSMARTRVVVTGAGPDRPEVAA
jgi:hypothetical protein